MLSLQTISLRKPELASLYMHHCGWSGRGDLIRTLQGCPECQVPYADDNDWICTEHVSEEEFEDLDWS